MLHASSFVARAAVVIAGLLALHDAGAGDRDGGRPSTNTFVLVSVATPKPSPTPLPLNGASVPPAKPIVSNPYQVPLLQNAGSLRAR